MTAIGPIQARRWHGRCRTCGEPGFAADRVLGVIGWLTIRAERMACKAGLHDPFRKAESLLEELSGWSVDGETLRRHTHAAASQATQTRSQRTELPQAFAAATGDVEVHIDAGKVNTLEGWRDVKVAVFAVRPRGAATDSDYEQRDLPAPAVRAILAAVEGVEAFGPRCGTEARRLGLTDPARISVLGDGADWIWNLADLHFAGAAQVLDVYHGIEKLAGVGRVVCGDGPAFAAWLDAARRLLVGEGYCGACEALQRTPSEPMAAERLAAASGPALNYFAGHRDRMNYAARLKRGQTIGSGLVEGTIKERVNLRLKRTGARWKAEHVGPFVELLALSDSPEWNEHWKLVAA